MVASILAFGPAAPAKADTFIPPADKDVCDLKGGVVTWDSSYKSEKNSSPGALVCIPNTGFPKNHPVVLVQANGQRAFCRAYTDENRDVYVQAGYQGQRNTSRPDTYYWPWKKAAITEATLSTPDARHSQLSLILKITCLANSQGLYTVLTLIQAAPLLPGVTHPSPSDSNVYFMPW